MIKVSNIHKRFGALEVLKGISLEVKKGELISIVGASGAGKTTLLQILGTLSRADEGTLTIDGHRVEQLSEGALARFRNEKIGFVFQFHHLLPEFSALENVMIPAFIARRPRKEAEADARELLTEMGLGDRLLLQDAFNLNSLSGLVRFVKKIPQEFVLSMQQRIRHLVFGKITKTPIGKCVLLKVVLKK